MKSTIIALIIAGLSSPAFGFHVLNQTNECVYVKEYFHIFNRYNQHLSSHETGYCDPSSPVCTGQLDFRVIKHSDGSEIQIEEPVCTWEGDVGTGQGYFIVTANPAVQPGEKDWCKIKYYRHS